MEKHDSVGISFPCWSLLYIIMHWLLPEPKGERSYFSICSRIQALHFFQQLRDSNHSLHTLQEAKVTVDEIEAPGEAEADAMCPGHQLLQLSRDAGGM